MTGDERSGKGVGIQMESDMSNIDETKSGSVWVLMIRLNFSHHLFLSIATRFLLYEIMHVLVRLVNDFFKSLSEGSHI